MENILDLIYKLLFEIEDSESKLLYIQLIKTHPHYKYICNEPYDKRREFNYIDLSQLLRIVNPENDFYFDVFPVKSVEIDRGWDKWFKVLKSQYEEIIKTST